MKNLIKLALVVIVGVLVYNFYFGTEEEKATSEKVFKQVKEVGHTVGDIIKKEKQKFADGKYDKTFDKLGDIYDDLKKKLDGGDRETKRELDRLERTKDKLEREKEELRRELEDADVDQEDIAKKSKSLEDNLNELMEKSHNLLDEILAKQKED